MQEAQGGICMDKCIYIYTYIYGQAFDSLLAFKTTLLTLVAGQCMFLALNASKPKL